MARNRANPDAAPKKKRNLWDRYETFDPSEGLGSVDQWRAAWEQMTGEQAQVVLSKNQSDPLVILGLASYPKTMDELKKAYRRASLIAHPDQGGSNEAMILLTAAYVKLSARF